MSEDRDKLLQVMNSLEADYRSGKISKEKYSYFRSKYEDKLNSIDAMEATKRIRSMQGKSAAPRNNNGRSRKPAVDKKKQEQDLVQKYIINPKKGDAKYNKKKKSSMNSGTFRLILVLVLVVAFTAGVAYGVFNFDFESGSNTTPVGIVEDTAFPEITAVVSNVTNTTVKDTSNTSISDTTDDDKEDEVETTTEEPTEQDSSYEPSSSDSESGSSDSGSGGSSSGGSGSGGSSSGGSGSGGSSSGGSGSGGSSSGGSGSGGSSSGGSGGSDSGSSEGGSSE